MEEIRERYLSTNMGKYNKGDSIIELIFAIGIVAITLTGALNLLVNMFYGRNKAIERKKATIIAEWVMEDKLNESMGSDIFSD